MKYSTLFDSGSIRDHFISDVTNSVIKLFSVFYFTKFKRIVPKPYKEKYHFISYPIKLLGNRSNTVMLNKNKINKKTL